MSTNPRGFLWTPAVLSLLLAALPSYGRAQTASAGFDTTRAILRQRTDRSVFKVHETFLLRDALRADKLQPSTSLLVLDRPGGQVALITDQMAYHHIAQGELNGEPWLVSFCVTCNTGMGMTPRVDGRVLHFVIGGAYNGLLLISDVETTSFWEHITGEALHGPLKGKHLLTSNLLHMPAGRAVEAYPTLRVAISNRPFRRESFLQSMDKWLGLSDMPFFKWTVRNEDTRLKTMDLGLGVWSGAIHRFYPLQHFANAGNAIVDKLDGRTIVVYHSMKEGGLDAFYAETSSARWNGDELRLDGDRVFRNGVLYDKTGKRREIERPMQLFTRWYGFALTFPQTEIYSPKRRST